jgi:phosphoserine phosphatase
MTPTSGIVFFDIDGTLVPSGSSSSYLAGHLGHQQELDAAEDRYASGELTNQQVSEIDAAGWRGARVTDVDLLLEELPLIPGIDDVLAWCRAQSLEPVLASLAWQPVSAALARRHGFTASGGPRVGLVGDSYDGTVAEHFDEYDKRDRALDLARQRGVPTDRCAAVGDSRSDIPLFQAVPASLALNAGAAARAAANHAINATDLREILPWLERWHSSQT